MSTRKLSPEYKLCERVRRKFREGIREFNLITDGDHILVGCSGGKDSMALLQLLGEMKRYSKVDFRVTAVHIKNENIQYKSDTAYLSEFSSRFDIPFSFHTISFLPDEQQGRTPCFLCSWNRRKALFEQAKELGCNKIALGHHKDDIIVTTLMNLSYNGAFSTMPALLQMRKMPLTIIRPLCKVDECDLKEWSNIFSYQPLLKVCPYDSDSHRTDMTKVVTALQDIAPEFKNNSWHALVKENKMIEK